MSFGSEYLRLWQKDRGLIWEVPSSAYSGEVSRSGVVFPHPLEGTLGSSGWWHDPQGVWDGEQLHASQGLELVLSQVRARMQYRGVTFFQKLLLSQGLGVVFLVSPTAQPASLQHTLGLLRSHGWWGVQVRDGLLAAARWAELGAQLPHATPSIARESVVSMSTSFEYREVLDFGAGALRWAVYFHDQLIAAQSWPEGGEHELWRTYQERLWSEKGWWVRRAHLQMSDAHGTVPVHQASGEIAWQSLPKKLWNEVYTAWLDQVYHLWEQAHSELPAQCRLAIHGQPIMVVGGGVSRAAWQERTRARWATPLLIPASPLYASIRGALL